jgi:branched-chain amino acid transport system ATP-binding protein
LALLDVHDVEVRFGGVHALQGVDLDVEEGRVTGLIGPNGAGKTTLFNVICGLQPPTRGTVIFDGEDITGVRAYKRARLGVGRTFQRLEVFGSLSVRDNLRVAAELRSSWRAGPPPDGDEDGAESHPDRIAAEVLRRVRLDGVADARTDALPTGMLRIVELGRALAAGPRLLLLDEPSSGLSDAESDLMGEIMVEQAKEGIAVLLVEHDVDLVMQVCDRIHVLDFGRIIASGTPEGIRADDRVKAAYLGTGGEADDAA